MKSKISLLFIVWVTCLKLNAQTAFDMKKEFPSPGFDPSPNVAQLQPIKHEKILAAFTYISTKSKAQFNYPQGGCPERAVVIHYLLDSLKIPNFRIWVFAPSKLLESSKEKIYITDKNKLTTDDNNRIEWDYHVAPCVLSSNGTASPDTLVIDPSINSKKPLKVKDWLSLINNSKQSKYCFLDGKYYQFNTKENGASNVINGYLYPYEGGAYDNLWVEKMMALNETAYTMYLKYVKNKDNSSQKVKDIKAVIGNSATLKEVLEYKDGLPAASKIRYITTNYPDFASDMWALYSKSFSAWAKRMKTLKA